MPLTKQTPSEPDCSKGIALIVIFISLSFSTVSSSPHHFPLTKATLGVFLAFSKNTLEFAKYASNSSGVLMLVTILFS